MDENETKLNASSQPARADRRRATLGAHHELLLDRLTRRPEPVRQPRITSFEMTAKPEAAHAAAEPKVPAAAIEERRKSPRRRMLKAGLLTFNGSFSAMKCTVRDLSDGGARLKVDQLAAIPAEFELIIEIDGLYAKSSVAWRKASEIGVRFLETPRTGVKLREQIITPRA